MSHVSVLTVNGPAVKRRRVVDRKGGVTFEEIRKGDVASPPRQVSANNKAIVADVVKQLRQTVIDESSKNSNKWVKILVHLDSHERRQMVRHVQQGMYMQFVTRLDGDWSKPPHRMRGLRNALARTFWPNYSDKDQLRDGASQTTLKFVKPKKRTDTNAASCLCTGVEHGTLVHRQIGDVIELVSHDKKLAYDASELDPCVLEIFNVLRDYKVHPIFTEYTVFDEDLGVATSIDILGVNANDGTLCIVEVTNGYSSLPFIHPPNMTRIFAEPLENVTDTPAQRKYLQSWFAAEILKRRYGVRDVSILLIRSNPRRSQIEIVTGMEWAREMSKARLTEVYESIAVA